MSNHKGFKGLFQRLVRNTAEPDNDQSCWLWTGPVRKRYPMLVIRHPETGKVKTLSAHRAVQVILECGEESELFLDLYAAYSASELQADHLCFANPLCINPDHLQWLTDEQHRHKNATEVHPDAVAP